jgi:hypothetical protein
MKKMITILACLCECVFIQAAVSQEKDAENRLGAESTIAALSKQLQLDTMQQRLLVNARTDYNFTMDSVLTYSGENKQKYEADKRWHTTLMKRLNDRQRIAYLTKLAMPEAKKRAEEKMKILQESNLYTESEIAGKRKSLMQYYLMEQIIVLRDFYDPCAKDENLKLLRAQCPLPLLEAEKIKDLRDTGQLRNTITLH